jgi:endonuclease YncB( thermonuclease family)
LAKHENSFILQSHGVGKYGRCLGEIILNEVNLNDLLITEGHAVKYDGGKR